MAKRKKLKKRTIRKLILVGVFVLGVIIGLLIPMGLILSKFRFGAGYDLYDISKGFGQLKYDEGGYEYSVIEDNSKSSVRLIKVKEILEDKSIRDSYVIVNRGSVTVGIEDSNQELGSSDMVRIHEGTKYDIVKTSDSPAEVVIISLK